MLQVKDGHSSWSLTSESPLLKRQRKLSDSTRSLPNNTKNGITERDAKGRTQFFLAIRDGNIQVARKLLNAGCDPNKPDKYLNSPLHEATEKSNGTMLDFLIETGCDLNARNILGQTPLMRAVLYDDLDSVKKLHKAGADLNETDCTGKTALLIGLEENRMDVVNFLIRSGCNVNKVDKLGQTAMYISKKDGKTPPDDLLKRLLKAGYDLNRDSYWMDEAEMDRIEKLPTSSHYHIPSASHFFHKIMSKVSPKHEKTSDAV